MSVYQMGELRIIDLSKQLNPETETRRCHLYRFNTGGRIPDFHTHMDLMSHLGTHVECPFHHHDDWPDVQGLPLTRFLGRAVYVKITDLKPNAHILPIDVERASQGKVRKGDIVILDSDYGMEPFTEKANTNEDQRLFVCRELAEWFAQKEVKCIGFGDGVSIENSHEDVSAFHDVLMAKGIVFLEVLKNLGKLRTDIFFMSYSPLPIKGLDSSPVRAYAIEGLAEFSK